MCLSLHLGGVLCYNSSTATSFGKLHLKKFLESLWFIGLYRNIINIIRWSPLAFNTSRIISILKCFLIK